MRVPKLEPGTIGVTTDKAYHASKRSLVMILKSLVLSLVQSALDPSISAISAPPRCFKTNCAPSHRFTSCSSSLSALVQLILVKDQH